MASPTNWRFSGDYFENCNCDVVCPCLASLRAPLTARPSQGVCDLALFFHIDRGSYGELSLDGLNVAVIAHWPGPMADGNGTLAAYIDERAGDRQTAALGDLRRRGGRPDGRLCAPRGRQSRCKEGADQLRDRRQIPFGGNPRHPHMAVAPLPTMHPSGEIWTALGHPIAPDRLALAVGSPNSTFADHGMRWDNSGKNGHYAPINWSN